MADSQNARQQTSGTGRSARRVLFAFACLGPLFVSTCLPTGGILSVVTYYDEDIPDGVVRTVEREKRGFRMTYADGTRATFPYAVAWGRPDTFDITPGVRVSKRRGTLAYVVNGRAFTDRGWLVERVPVATTAVVSAAYVGLGAAYCVRYRRSPLGDLFRRTGRGRRPFDRPRLTVGRVCSACAVLVVAWVVAVVLEIAALGLLGGWMGVALRAIVGDW